METRVCDGAAEWRSGREHGRCWSLRRRARVGAGGSSWCVSRRPWSGCVHVRHSNCGHTLLRTAAVCAAMIDSSFGSAGTGSWPCSSRGGRRHVESIHPHSGKGVLGIRIEDTKGSIGREQGCGSPVRRISPSAISAEREDRVSWMMLFAVRCQHRYGE